MNTRIYLSIGAATLALSAAQPAFAQSSQDMGFGTRAYEYAVPAVTNAQQAAPVVYQSQPVVQAIPAQNYATEVVGQQIGSDFPPQMAQPYAAQPYTAQPQVQPQAYAAHPQPVQQQVYQPAQQQYYAPPAPVAQPAPVQYAQPQFDRGAWLAECRDRIRGHRSSNSGTVTGGLLGGAVGAIAGNAIAGRGDRLAGSLIGGGVGGLAGLALGSGADSSRRRDYDEYCEAYLDRYMHNQQGYGQQGYVQQGYQQPAYAQPAPYYGGHGYAQQVAYAQPVTYAQPMAYAQPVAYSYAQPMMLVQVQVPVQQRAVVREYVTERIIPQTRYETIIEYEEVRRPVRTKRRPVRYIKSKRIRTSK